MIGGVNHITLAVADLERSFAFYVDVLGCRPLARWQQGAYLLAGPTWLCLSLDEQTRGGPLPEYTHVAFDAEPEHFPALRERLRAAGADEWRQNSSEGASIYVLDPDGHKLELHAGDWKSRLRACRERPYAGMTFFDE